MTATLERKTTSKPSADPIQPMAASCVPMVGETQAQFFDRGLRALKAQFPEINRRTVEVLKLWQQSPNDADLRSKAAARFPVEQFTHFGPRCIFLEHTIPEVAEITDPQTGTLTQPGREGTKYGRNELQKLVDWANYRIRNADQFAALSDGHMPTAEEKSTGRPDADVLGWSGPFYLGCFGNVNPQWAIYSDEWVHNDDVPRFQKLQRRSPEVWCKEPIERRTMDPIAALGSETPRLDSGMNLYSLRADGQTVMRYSMGMSMALPGPDNTYVPGGETGRKQKYGANDMFNPANGQQQAPDMGQQPGQDGPPDQGGSDPIVDAVIQAIAAQLPSIIQAVKQSMQSGDPSDGDAVPPDTDPSMGGADATGPDAQDVPRGMDAPAPPDSDPAAQQAPAVPPAGQSPQNQAGDPDQAKYEAMGQQCGMAYAAGLQKGRSTMQKYSKGSDDGLAGVVARQAEQLKRATTRIDELERDKRDVECYSKIREIAAVHNIGDVKEHVAAIIDADDEQVERYCRALTLAPKHDDVTNVELFNDPELDQDRERYSRGGTGNGSRVTESQITKYKRQAEDIAIAKNHKQKGSTTFAAEFEAICKANGVPV